MLVTRKTQRLNRFKGITFNIALIAIVGSLAWLSTRYSLDADWTDVRATMAIGADMTPFLNSHQAAFIQSVSRNHGPECRQLF